MDESKIPQKIDADTGLPFGITADDLAVQESYETMTREELIECCKAHDAHHEEHHVLQHELEEKLGRMMIVGAEERAAALTWFNRANWDERTPHIKTIRALLSSPNANVIDQLKIFDTANIRWLLAEARPEIGWPQRALDALVDVTKLCELIENFNTTEEGKNNG